MVLQENWRWCSKCQVLLFAGYPQLPNVCLAGGQHDTGTSGNYVLIDSVPSAVGQHGWKWCYNCQDLFYGEPSVTQGLCVLNQGGLGPHDGTQSGDYTLFNNDPAAFGQPDWRWCRKCYGLFYGQFYVTQGLCAAGGPHDGTQSGEYQLMHYKD
jgi:hypothetical protein